MGLFLQITIIFNVICKAEMDGKKDIQKVSKSSYGLS